MLPRLHGAAVGLDVGGDTTRVLTSQGLHGLCDNGPASSPIRHTGNSSSSKYLATASGSLATLTSRTTSPFASTTHTLLYFRETSIPAYVLWLFLS